jgi:hypothetical protein
VFASGTQANFQNFFTLLFSNQSTRSAGEAQAANVAQIGGNATINVMMSDSFTLLFSVLVSSPNESQKTIIRQRFTELVALVDALFSSFPGLENYQNSTVLRSNPDNARFYQLYDQFLTNALEIMANPGYALEFYSNSSTIENIIEQVALGGKISLQAQIR